MSHHFVWPYFSGFGGEQIYNGDGVGLDAWGVCQGEGGARDDCGVSFLEGSNYARVMVLDLMLRVFARRKEKVKIIVVPVGGIGNLPASIFNVQY